MLIRRMTAAFGRFNQETLELSDGLNILMAPNEAGKSTWCAFLSAMLYGLPTRDHGLLADKNRYAPWNGAVMQGRLDCQAGGRELTLLRETKRQTSPLGMFTALYAGTGDPVPDLTGQNCGEQLLGVPREVFERSALIRQSGLSITQDAELERRILSLITTGEEDTSYMEAADALKKQLNRRRHNRTGQLPALEAELQEIRQQRESLLLLERQLADTRTRRDALAQREAGLSAQLEQYERCDAIAKRKSLQTAETAANEAARRGESLRHRAEEENLPDNDTIARLRAAIVNLETLRKSVAQARSGRDAAHRDLLRAEAAVNDGPFAGQTAEGARTETRTPPKVRVNLLLPFLVGAAVLLLATFCALWLEKYWVESIGVGLAPLLSWRLSSSARATARRAALVKRFGTSDPAELAALADSYAERLAARDAAKQAAAVAGSTADSLSASLTSNEQAILLEIRRFAPSAFDLSAADALLRSCAVRRRELAEAESAAKEARLRCEILAQQLPDSSPLSTDDLALTLPEESRTALSAQWEQAKADLAEARSAEDRLKGRLTALGDPAVLSAREEELQTQSETLEGEYASIQLAMQALDSANTILQNRFSPALGRRAAEIFSELTDGRYSGVVLDRAFHLSAEPAGNSVYRDAQLLSAGTADQLYLAVRLAICELVLPAEKQVPIVLDDALANFDDVRCAAALRWLRKEAGSRQILLFTCHSREAEFLRGAADVSIQQLTDAQAAV